MRTMSNLFKWVDPSPYVTRKWRYEFWGEFKRRN